MVYYLILLTSVEKLHCKNKLVSEIAEYEGSWSNIEPPHNSFHAELRQAKKKITMMNMGNKAFAI